MKKRTIILLSVIFILVLMAAYLLYQLLITTTEADNFTAQETSETAEMAQESTQESLELAPDFTVTDKDGNLVNLSDFRGKPVVVNFWASWCSPCKSEMPEFQELYEEYGDDIHFLMVNLTDGSRETVETASEFIVSEGYSFPVYFDTENSNAATAYGTYSIPVTYFFDEEGYAIAQGTGAMDRDTLQKGIDMIYP